MSSDDEAPTLLLVGKELLSTCESLFAYRKCLEVRREIGEGYSSLHHLLTCCSEGNLEMCRALIGSCIQYFNFISILKFH